MPNTVLGDASRLDPRSNCKDPAEIPTELDLGPVTADPWSNYAGTLISVYVTNERVELDLGSVSLTAAVG